MSFVDEFSIVAAGGGWAALYLDSLSKCEQVGTGDSPCRLGSRDRPLAGASLVPIARRKSEQLTGRASPHRARSDACDLSEQRGRDVSALVNRNCSDATISVAELFVRTALANLSEAQPLQPCHDLTRLEDRWLGHESRHDSLDADELGFKLGFAILK